VARVRSDCEFCLCAYKPNFSVRPFLNTPYVFCKTVLENHGFQRKILQLDRLSLDKFTFFRVFFENFYDLSRLKDCRAML